MIGCCFRVRLAVRPTAESGDVMSRGRAFAWALSAPDIRAWRTRAFAGVTRQRVGVVLAFCLVWALSVTVHDLLASWRAGETDGWLVWRVGGEFACIVAIAATMALPLVVVGNLGPQTGWRRAAALAVAIALAAPLATAERWAYMTSNDTETDPPVRLTQYPLWWVRYATLAALFTIVIEFQRRESRSVESMHRAEIDRLALDREMDEARLQVLQAQIEPHFLFNTLANVRRLYQTDLAGGRAMLQNLMRYLEVALPHMRENRSTLGRELALVEAYLGVQLIRMGRRLAFRIDVAESLRAFDLPPMMLLTLVENAIKHGLNPLPEGGTVVITAREDAGRMRVDVADDGRGFHATSGGGTGLANIHARLAAMYGEAASLTLVENQPGGVVSTLQMPARRVEAAPS